MTAPSLFEIVPLTGDPLELPPPDNGPYYVATKDGMMAMQHTHWGRYLVPIKTINHLPEQKQAIFWNDIPKMPAALVGQVLSFFQSIFEKRQSEAMVDLTWSPEKGYRAFIPPQRASSGGVNATRNWEHIHGLHVGTIHSHCDFGAFHSGTDEHDADGHNGLHITIGKVNTVPEFAVMFAHNGHKWDTNFTIDDVVDGPIVPVAHPAWWEKFVQDPAPRTQIVKYMPRTPTTTSWPNKHEHAAARSQLMYGRGSQHDYTVIRNGRPQNNYFGSLTSLALTAEFSNKPFEDAEVDAMQGILAEVERYFEGLGVSIEFAFHFLNDRFGDLTAEPSIPTDDDDTLPWSLFS